MKTAIVTRRGFAYGIVSRPILRLTAARAQTSVSPAEVAIEWHALAARAASEATQSSEL
jgi:hypothetical protein